MSLELLSSLDELEARVRALTDAESPGAVFKVLLDASRLAAPRSAIFLIRQGGVRGWGSVGYSAQVTQRQRQYQGALDRGWPIELIADAERTVHRRSDGVRDPDFGQSLPAEAAAALVRLKSKPIALLLTERSAGEAPWFPQALSLLVLVAQLRLDLDLAQRKRTEAPRQAVPIASPAPESQELAEVGGVPAPEAPRLDAARRFARLVATDIRLYNEEAVLSGRRKRDLVERLSEHLTRGKETFLRRHGDLGPAGLEILHEAYVNVLAGGDTQLLPTSVMD